MLHAAYLPYAGKSFTPGLAGIPRGTPSSPAWGHGTPLHAITYTAVRQLQSVIANPVADGPPEITPVRAEVLRLESIGISRRSPKVGEAYLQRLLSLLRLLRLISLCGLLGLQRPPGQIGPAPETAVLSCPVMASQAFSPIPPSGWSGHFARQSACLELINQALEAQASHTQSPWRFAPVVRKCHCIK